MTHLPHVHVVAKYFQGGFHHDFSWQLVAGVKDNIALEIGLHVVMCQTQLVVAGLCRVVMVCLHVIVLQSVRYLLSKPKENKYTNKYI